MSFDSVNTVYGSMPANLNCEKLIDLCEESGVQTGPFGSQLHQEDYVADGTPIITVEHLGENSIVHVNLPRVSDEDKTRLSKYVLKKGDIVFSRVGSVDRRALVKATEDGWLFSGRCLRVRSKPEVLNAEWLSYFFGLPAFKNYIRGIAVGATMPSINTKILSDVPIYFPEIDVQRRAANVLSLIDDRITLLRETNSTLEDIAQALFKSWFVDFDPVRAKAEGKLPEGMDEATAALFPDAFEMTEFGEVPKGWVVDSFGNWIDVLETGRRPKGGVSGIDSGIPSIGAESVTRIGEFDYSKLKFVPADFFEKMKAGKLQSKDVLLYKDGGKPGVFLPRVSMFGDGFPFEVCGINEHVFRLRAKQPLGQTFLYFWLWSDSVMHELKHRGGKAAIPGINQSDVKELKIAVPEGKIAIQFEEITSPLVSKILANAKSIKTLSNLRDTLLPRLISGQLRIADAEAELKKVTA
jgi:type I restriction enzyme, S subunit